MIALSGATDRRLRLRDVLQIESPLVIQGVEKNAVLRFETQGYRSTEEAVQSLVRGEVDCLFPVNLSSYDGEQLGIIITDTYATTEL